MKKYLFILIALMFMPKISLAQPSRAAIFDGKEPVPVTGSNQTFQDIVVGIVRTLSGYAITLIAALSVLMFVWGVTKYIWKGDSKEERKKGKVLMFWGIIAFFVMFSVWGIVEILGETFFGHPVGIPQF